MGLRKQLEQAYALIEELRKENEELRHRLLAYENAHTPSSQQRKKNTPLPNQNKPRFPGKPKESNGGGIKIPPPDKIVEHTLEFDPVSGKPLGKPVGYRKKIVIDFPDKPIQVIEHRIMQYLSPCTGEIIEPKTDLPNTTYGKNLQSIVVLLKNLTNSHAKISDFLQELGAPSFSTAQVQKIADLFADKLEPEREKLLKQIRQEPHLHADETGLRKDGKNGYIWGIFTNSIAIFSAQMSRARKCIQTLLPKYIGVVVSDGYNAYYEFLHRQRCWAHLLREFKDYSKNNNEITIQLERIKLLYEQLKKLKQKPPDKNKIAKVKWQLQDIVTCLKTIKQANGLATLIENGGDDWFTALHYKDVPLENNLAERELRPIVLLRKVIGCYRNEKGKRWIDIVLSVLHTWKLQGKNLFQQLNKVSS